MRRVAVHTLLEREPAGAAADASDVVGRRRQRVVHVERPRDAERAEPRYLRVHWPGRSRVQLHQAAAGAVSAARRATSPLTVAPTLGTTVGGMSAHLALYAGAGSDAPAAALALPRARGVRDAACPLSTRGGTRLVRLVLGRGGGGGGASAPWRGSQGTVAGGGRLCRCRAAAVRDAACPLSTRGGTRLVRLVRGKGGGGGKPGAQTRSAATAPRGTAPPGGVRARKRARAWHLPMQWTKPGSPGGARGGGGRVLQRRARRAAPRWAVLDPSLSSACVSSLLSSECRVAPQSFHDL